MARIDYIERATISARFLLAAAPAATVVPEGFVVTQCPARRAAGAYRVKSGASGSQPTGAALAPHHRPRGLMAYATLSHNRRV